MSIVGGGGEAGIPQVAQTIAEGGKVVGEAEEAVKAVGEAAEATAEAAPKTFMQRQFMHMRWGGLGFAGAGALGFAADTFLPSDIENTPSPNSTKDSIIDFGVAGTGVGAAILAKLTGEFEHPVSLLWTGGGMFAGMIAADSLWGATGQHVIDPPFFGAIRDKQNADEAPEESPDAATTNKELAQIVEALKAQQAATPQYVAPVSPSVGTSKLPTGWQFVSPAPAG